MTVTVTMGDWEQQTFDWESNSDAPVSSVIVKGMGNMNVNFYEYDEPVTSDTGLHAPIDIDRSMEPFDLKKIRFCYEEEEEQPPTSEQPPATEAPPTTAPPEDAAPPPAPPAQPVVGQPNFVG